MRRALAMIGGASPAAVLSGSRSAAVVIAAGAAASLILPLIGRALAGLPEWGTKMHELREEVRASRYRRHQVRRRARAARARRRRAKL